MQENVQKEENGVSLLEIFRLLLSKIKLLLLVVVIAGIVGGGLGLYTSWNDLYFGTNIEFYVNPEKPKANAGEGASQFGVYGAYGRHVMDNMVKLLESESFTEQLLLNGDRLPKLKYSGKNGDTTPLGVKLNENESWSWIPEPTAEERASVGATTVFEYDTFKNALFQAETLRKEANGMITKLDAKVQLKENQTQTYNQLSVDFANHWRSLYVKKVLEHSSFWQMEFDALREMHETAFISDDVQTLIDTYDAVEAAKLDLAATQESIDKLNEDYFNKADDAEKTVLNLWRASTGYKTILSMYSEAVSYSYLEANADIDDANNLARSFIYVNISVVGEQNQDFAKEVHKRVQEIVPSFVKKNMTVPADYQGTNCERITRTDEIQRTNPNHRTKQVIKYSLLFAAAAFVIAAVVIIIIDKSDKRLRETEIITRKFNVPILGIVPSIEELNEDAHAKKIAANKAAKNTTKEAK